MARSAKFDKEDADSPFLSFVRREFHQGRGTKLRAQLANKTTSHDFVRNLGLSVPETLATLHDLEDLRSLDLPNQFVLKYAHGWSARGVMLLECTSKNRFFCHLSQRHLSLENVIRRQRNVADTFSGEDVWLVEQMVESTIEGKRIPFDYKFYCFRGRVGLVAQIDRNVFPPKVTLLDADFAPLLHKTDYILRSKNAQTGLPVVPLHAHSLLYWARCLSKNTDSPFVSIDLYDSPSGPVFGEFTFSPGGTHRRMWVFRDTFIDRLDEFFVQGQKEMEEGAESPAQPPLPDISQRRISPDTYRILASSVLDGSVRAPVRLKDLSQAIATSEGPDILRAWSEIESLAKQRLSNNFEDRKRFMQSHDIAF